MSLLDGLLGGVVGGEMATVVNGFIERHGGVQGIVAQMEQQGLGNTVKRRGAARLTRSSIETSRPAAAADSPPGR